MSKSKEKDLAKFFKNVMVSSEGDKQSSSGTTSSVLLSLLSSVQS
jgi:hypothetical protein